MFDDEVREQIFAKSELQKIDLMTLSLAIKAIEEVLEDNKDEHAVSATNAIYGIRHVPNINYRLIIDLLS